MTDPRFRMLYKTLGDAPHPPPDTNGFWIAVEVFGGRVQDYVSQEGLYRKWGEPYVPAPGE